MKPQGRLVENGRKSKKKNFQLIIRNKMGCFVTELKPLFLDSTLISGFNSRNGALVFLLFTAKLTFLK